MTGEVRNGGAALGTWMGSTLNFWGQGGLRCFEAQICVNNGKAAVLWRRWC